MIIITMYSTWFCIHSKWVFSFVHFQLKIQSNFRTSGIRKKIKNLRLKMDQMSYFLNSFSIRVFTLSMHVPALPSLCLIYLIFLIYHIIIITYIENIALPVNPIYQTLGSYTYTIAFNVSTIVAGMDKPK